MPEKLKKIYGTRWISFKAVPLGGFWAYAIGIVEDIKTGDKKIRIAKGKVKGIVKRVEGKLEYIFASSDDPITQVNRLNIKRRKEWNEIKKLVEEYFDMLEKHKGGDK